MSEEQASQEAVAETIPQQQQEPVQVVQTREASPPEIPSDDPIEDESGLQDMMVKRLYEDMGVLVKDEEAPVASPQPEEKAEVTEEPEAEETEKEEAAAEEVPKAKRRTVVKERDTAQELIESLSEVLAEKKKTEELPVPPDPEPVDDEAGLMDEQRLELELASYAEQKMPDKYSGMRGKMLSFYKELDEWVGNKQAEDPEFNAENNFEEINEWVEAKKPALSKVDEKKLERQLIREQAIAEFKSESESKFRDLELKTKAIEAKPKIEKDMAAFTSSILSMEGFDAAELLKEGKTKEAMEKHPMQAQVASQVLGQVEEVYRDYLAYDNGLEEWGDSKDTHRWLNRFLTEQGDFLYRSGGDNSVRGGKEFLPVTEFNKRYQSDPAKTDSRYWTFDRHDVRELLAVAAQQQIKTSIKGMEDQIEQYGYSRQPAQSEDKRTRAEDPEPVKAPKSTVTPSPGSAESQGGDTPNSAGADIVSTLGLRDKFPDFLE
tara:strand:+ start:8368 stop:9837 length:1470 start_codon:yes stop_codon:yes gene_type:complete